MLSSSAMIYLDNNATTRIDERVLEAMLPYLREAYGNAASRQHAFGWQAESAVSLARERIASTIGAEPSEIVFTSGATESDNLALKGVIEAYAPHRDHVVTTATEHSAVLDACRTLQRRGIRVTILGVDTDGFIDLDALRRSVIDRTAIVSIMHGNNEIGTIQDIAAIGAICREHGALFHTDATQTVGKIPFNVDDLCVDLASFSAHKIHGPKGCGALYTRRRKPNVRLTAQIDGGGHERGLRSGTLNVPGIVGFGAALELAAADLTQEIAHGRRLRDALWSSLRETIADIRLNGPDPTVRPEQRLPGNLNVAFAHVNAEMLMAEMKGLAVSTGSACASASLKPSHVLKAIGLDDALSHASIRLGVSRFTTDQEIRSAAMIVREAVENLRRASSSSFPSEAHNR